MGPIQIQYSPHTISSSSSFPSHHYHLHQCHSPHYRHFCRHYRAFWVFTMRAEVLSALPFVHPMLKIKMLNTFMITLDHYMSQYLNILILSFSVMPSDTFAYHHLALSYHVFLRILLCGQLYAFIHNMPYINSFRNAQPALVTFIYIIDSFIWCQLIQVLLPAQHR